MTSKTSSHESDSVRQAEAVEKVKQNKNITLIVYALQAGAFLFGISAIVGVVINYVKRDEVQDTWLASHFKWQIRTFWWSLLGFVIGFLTWFIFIGILIYIVTYVWVIYRVVKGFLRFNSQQVMY